MGGGRPAGLLPDNLRRAEASPLPRSESEAGFLLQRLQGQLGLLGALHFLQEDHHRGLLGVPGLSERDRAVAVPLPHPPGRDRDGPQAAALP